jgi:hypothetical protein
VQAKLVENSEDGVIGEEQEHKSPPDKAAGKLQKSQGKNGQLVRRENDEKLT